MHARAQRLKHVFGINIETCPTCRGSVMIIARIEDFRVIEKILTHLNRKTPYHGTEPVTQEPRSDACGSVWPTLSKLPLPLAIAAASVDAAGGLVTRRPESEGNWAQKHQKAQKDPL
jgi:hypothetical protein